MISKIVLKHKTRPLLWKQDVGSSLTLTHCPPNSTACNDMIGVEAAGKRFDLSSVGKCKNVLPWSAAHQNAEWILEMSTSKAWIIYLTVVFCERQWVALLPAGSLCVNTWRIPNYALAFSKRRILNLKSNSWQHIDVIIWQGSLPFHTDI